MVALDPWRGYASALVALLSHARVVVDHFHAVRLANMVVDQTRRRCSRSPSAIGAARTIPCTASATSRKLLLTAAEQLTQRRRAWLRAGFTAGDPGGEVAPAWQGKELLRAGLRRRRHAGGPRRLDRFYRWADGIGAGR